MLKSALNVWCAVGLLVASVALSHAQNSENAMSKIANGVYHFWAMGYSSLVVMGENGVLIVDPAFSARAKMLQAEIRKISDRPVTHVVLTHEHYDHAGGSEVFSQAEVICQRACEKMFELDVIGMAPKKVHQTFDDKLSLDLGSHRVDLYHVAPGDGRAATLIHLPNEKIVASADMYAPRGFTNSAFIQDSSYLGLRKNLAKLIALNPTYAVNGHSPGNSVEALKENA